MKLFLKTYKRRQKCEKKRAPKKWKSFGEERTRFEHHRAKHIMWHNIYKVHTRFKSSSVALNCALFADFNSAKFSVRCCELSFCSIFALAGTFCCASVVADVAIVVEDEPVVALTILLLLFIIVGCVGVLFVVVELLAVVVSFDGVVVVAVGGLGNGFLLLLLGDDDDDDVGGGGV